MSKKEIEVHVDKGNKIDFKEFIEMKIKYDDEYFKKDQEIERLNNIIKEVREYCNNDSNFEIMTDFDTFENHNIIGKDILEILDKVGSNKE